jgi:hypothetical protein
LGFSFWFAEPQISEEAVGINIEKFPYSDQTVTAEFKRIANENLNSGLPNGPTPVLKIPLPVDKGSVFLGFPQFQDGDVYIVKVTLGL